MSQRRTVQTIHAQRDATPASILSSTLAFPDQSLNPMSILKQFSNPIPICHLPINHQSLPISHFNANSTIHCQSTSTQLNPQKNMSHISISQLTLGSSIVRQSPPNPWPPRTDISHRAEGTSTMRTDYSQDAIVFGTTVTCYHNVNTRPLLQIQ